MPTELYDAAKVDGANSWQSFRNVTFPMISPVIFYNVTLSMVGLFQYFVVPLVVNNGTGRPGGDDVLQPVFVLHLLYFPGYVVWVGDGLDVVRHHSYCHHLFVWYGSLLGVLCR